MCNKNNLNHLNTTHNMQRRSKRMRNSMIINSMNKRGSNKKSRSKTRKPKFLSLKKQLSQENMSTQQLNLFPLHPENLVDDKTATDIQDENVALLFHNSDNGEGSASLSGLLTNTNTNTATTTTTTPASSEEESMNFTNFKEDQQCRLVRTAMRNREREYGREEKWVCYSEVVETKEMEEDTSSSCAFGEANYKTWREKRSSTNDFELIKGSSSLALKLDDYEGILNAWSDSGRSLYIQQDCPRTVPDLSSDDILAHDNNNMAMDILGGSRVGDVWKVPEMGGNNVMSCDGSRTKNNEKELEGRENWKLGQREASVLRYKEKRQNRLFSKRIRYEVRKLNAEKRPRMKGRFVKRSSEDDE